MLSLTGGGPVAELDVSVAVRGGLGRVRGVTAGRDEVPDYVTEKFLQKQRKREKEMEAVRKSRAKVNLDQVVQKFFKDK